MHRLSIRQLFLVLIVVSIFIAIVYISTSFLFLKQSVEKSLDLESINKAYYVTKKLTEMNDKIAKKYDRYEEEMYESLEEAQIYLQEHSIDGSLDELKKKLEKNREDIIYHIYIINNDFVITNTTYEADMGLDFHVIPDSLQYLSKVYKDKEYIDLSSVKDDAVAQDYKRYILQHSISGDYLVQLSLGFKSEHIKEFTSNLSKQIPSLLNSQIYSIYSDAIPNDGIYLIWSQKYLNLKKQDRLFSRDVYEMFMSQFDPENTISEEEYKKRIFEFAQNKQYKDSYFYKDGRYIHQVIMPFYSYINADEGTVHILIVEFDETEAKDTVERIILLKVIVWIFLALLALVGVVLIKKRIIYPILMLQEKMKNKSLIENKILTKNKDEITTMMQIYNQLLRDLHREILSNEELLEQFKVFTGNTIHQIRTPISVIKIALEMIETPNKDALLQIESSLISVEHMYDSLAYSLQEGDVAFVAEELSFSKLLQERIELFRTVALAHDIDIESFVQAELYVKLNPIEAEYLIDNNLSNAIKYTNRAKNIQVNLLSVKGEILFSIASAGEKIEDTDLIFERYHRSDTSRRGSGIGLHIVKNICQKNSILINVEYESGYNKFSYYLSQILH